MSNIINKEFPQAVRETLLVLDATTGKNAVSQAREFDAVSDLSGIVLTKLDGTAKGGIVLTIVDELHIPVKFIGVGEGLEDLQPFSPQEFVGGIFDE
jgi:fused signal recognition particle receptor